MKRKENSNNIDFVKEAEKIINEYMLKNNIAVNTVNTTSSCTNKPFNNTNIISTKKPVNPNKKIDMFLYSSISLCCIMLTFLFVYTIL